MAWQQAMYHGPGRRGLAPGRRTSALADAATPPSGQQAVAVVDRGNECACLWTCCDYGLLERVIDELPSLIHLHLCSIAASSTAHLVTPSPPRTRSPTHRAGLTPPRILDDHPSTRAAPIPRPSLAPGVPCRSPALPPAPSPPRVTPPALIAPQPPLAAAPSTAPSLTPVPAPSEYAAGYRTCHHGQEFRDQWLRVYLQCRARIPRHALAAQSLDLRARHHITGSELVQAREERRAESWEGYCLPRSRRVHTTVVVVAALCAAVRHAAGRPGAVDWVHWQIYNYTKKGCRCHQIKGGEYVLG
ncbi:hypothetical protein JB92DRAFT_2836077 [Gautieria morchelliformis]|nr:hypothetical protein JB92DRAFT_2836077 [Gautieria morchelliformis]